ncbi:MAG: DUF6693 family protein [Lamprobacter sp.]|uniref:DUF6693 family protein n=1 Tax=Lamprobacter sp. TaxID=3100796 RepID=UPI002B26031F|nr:DUF6693 family protein [Lamprobacter sp.]MEA3643976.1 DUF6693 family protein [Lamprobacter sp.]
MKRYRIACNLNFGQILIQTILWIILTVLTFGLALPFFAYYFIKIILNNTEIHEF